MLTQPLLHRDDAGRGGDEEAVMKRHLQGGGRRDAEVGSLALPPGVAAERRLRGSEVNVLVHARRVVVCHPATTRQP